ncbi:hypothetical protein [Cellulophaga sp. BC115SP]|uniref:hypothetical protein n=1 Tax=Cellulophaga sp. BC115SP TaxID=2683263 RepID=UPI00141304C1|nr:hypothetical protein [Cellulophaga sp. BC115SP]NBB29941.1 hypothetical protein [Cellulophaga sp. BC115SP]
MKVKYYYVDDDPLNITQETAKGLSIYPDKLEIEAFQHHVWNEQVSFLIDNQAEFNGLLLDWKLKKTNQNNEEADYNVEALAQQLRAAIIETKFKKDFPIILCSADSRFDELYTKDVTGHDLFDLVVKKDDFNDKVNEIISKFVDLAQGYQIIAEDMSVQNLFKIEELNYIDYRVLDYMNNLKSKSVHEIARFILTKIINVPCFLINEYLLVSRLGIDIQDKESKESWNHLKDEYLIDSKYNGVFSNGWERWWMPKVLNFWHHNFETSLGSVTASEKITMLNEKFGLSLKSAKIMEMAQSEQFWTVCKETNLPLAIEDGILYSSNDFENVPWQEDEYYSIWAVLEGGAIQIHPLERERVSFYKKKFTKSRNNEGK